MLSCWAASCSVSELTTEEASRVLPKAVTQRCPFKLPPTLTFPFLFQNVVGRNTSGLLVSENTHTDLSLELTESFRIMTQSEVLTPSVRAPVRNS